MATYTTITTKPAAFEGARIVWYIADVLEILLMFRFLLKLLGANPTATFTNLIYQITYAFASPFLSVFPSTPVAGGVFEWNALLAMLVYYLLALIIVRLFFMSTTVSRSETVTNNP